MSWIDVDGLTVHFNAPVGLPTFKSDLTLLLVHGAGGSSRHWEPMLKALEITPRSQVVFPIAVDLPGHGATDGYVADSIEVVAAFLNRFLDKLEIQHPVCYVGQSMGGLIGLQFALTYPEQVEQLVLIATSARIQLHPDFLQQALTGKWDMVMLRQSFAPDVPESLKDIVLNEFQHTRFPVNASDFMQISQVDLSDAISNLQQVPTLILTGDEDVIISPRKSSILQQQIPGSRLVKIPCAGHYLHVEKSEIVAKEIMYFLEQVRCTI